MPFRPRILTLFLLAVFLSGCFPSRGALLAEKEEISYRRGQQRLKEGRPEEALEAFLSVIKKRQEAPESHLEAGLLYLNRFGEPILAIYHFNEYLRSKPSPEPAERVRALIVTAKKEFARSLPASPFGGEVDKLDLKELLDKTRTENESLKAELMQVRAEVEHYKDVEQARRSLTELSTSASAPEGSAPAPASASAVSTSASSSARQYTVVQGDSLFVIAKKVYGSGARWKEIAEANRDTLPDPARLKLGQTLTIP